MRGYFERSSFSEQNVDFPYIDALSSSVWKREQKRLHECVLNRSSMVFLFININVKGKTDFAAGTVFSVLLTIIFWSRNKAVRCVGKGCLGSRDLVTILVYTITYEALTLNVFKTTILCTSWNETSRSSVLKGSLPLFLAFCQLFSYRLENTRLYWRNILCDRFNVMLHSKRSTF